MTDSTQTASTAATAPTTPPTAQAGTGAELVAPVSPAPPGAGLEAIQTWTEPAPTDRLEVTISGRTGEPTRVWTIWVAAAASYLATGLVGIATLVVYWNASLTGSMVRDEATGDMKFQYDDSRFAQASWLMGQFETEPGSLGRVLLAVAVTVIAVLVGTSCAITGYYAYDGRRWTRWAGLVSLVLAPLSLMLNPVAWPVTALAAIAAAALWLPPSSRYFAAWHALRHRDPVFSQPPDQVVYGPLPKYR